MKYNRFRLSRLNAGTGLLLVLCLVPYLNALRGGFVFDDIWLIVKHPAVQEPFHLGRILTAHYWGEIREALLWRPVTTFSFALDRSVAGGGAAWPHAVNLLLHATATLLWAAFVRRTTRSGSLAWIGGALFAVHPIHTEAVTWVSGRAELLAGIFTLAALLSATAREGRRRWLAAPLALLAIGSKESAVVLPLLLLFLWWRSRGEEAPPRPRLALGAFAVAVLYVIVRRIVLGSWGAPATDPMDNPMVGTSSLGRLPTVLDAAGRYVALLVWPASLSIDYSAPARGLVRGLTPMLALGGVAVVGLLFLAIRRGTRPEGIASGFAVLTFALASNLFLVIGTIFAERLLYLPSAGLLLLPAIGGLSLARRRPRLALPLGCLLALALLALSARTWDRNRDYRDERTLYESGIRAQPKSPKMRYNLALALWQGGENERAVSEAKEALRLNPSSREARSVLARALHDLGRTTEGIRILRGLLPHDPTDPKSRHLLIYLYDEIGRKAAADSVAEAGVVEDPGNVEWWAITAKRAQDRGDYRLAASRWREAMARSSESVDVPLYLGFCLHQLGDWDGARRAYEKGLELDPKSGYAANAVAWSILESGGSLQEAIRYARTAVRVDPQAHHYDTLARALIESGDCPGALEAGREACRLAPSNEDYARRLRLIEERCPQSRETRPGLLP